MPDSTNSSRVYPHSPPAAQPHRNPNPYPATHNAHSHHQGCAQCLIVAVMIMLVLSPFIVLILADRNSYRNPEFRVDFFSLSGFNASSSQFTGNFDVELFVRNPNKKFHIAYTKFHALLFYQDELLTAASIPLYEQDGWNETTVRTEFMVMRTYMKADLVGRIGNDLSSGNVSFNLELMGEYTYLPELFGYYNYGSLQVLCKDLPLRCSSNSSGTMDSQKRCNVY